MVNPVKLHQELESGGLPIVSVDATGALIFERELDEAERERAREICLGHDPRDRAAERQQAYLRAGINPQAMIAALWELLMEDRPEAAQAMQARREAIKLEIE